MPAQHIKLTLASESTDTRRFIDPIDEFLYKRLRYSDLDALNEFNFTSVPMSVDTLLRDATFDLDATATLVQVYISNKNRDIKIFRFDYDKEMCTDQKRSIQEIFPTLKEEMSNAKRMVIVMSKHPHNQPYQSSIACLFNIVDKPSTTTHTGTSTYRGA